MGARDLCFERARSPCNKTCACTNVCLRLCLCVCVSESVFVGTGNRPCCGRAGAPSPPAACARNAVCTWSSAGHTVSPARTPCSRVQPCEHYQNICLNLLARFSRGKDETRLFWASALRIVSYCTACGRLGELWCATSSHFYAGPACFSQGERAIRPGLPWLSRLFGTWLSRALTWITWHL